MINKSKSGWIVFFVTMVLTSPAFAANPPNYGPQFYAPSQSGGGSIGYNQELETYRLKHPHAHRAVRRPGAGQ
jgi:hypothetical protein